MNLLTMAKLGITVISGLILSVGSVGNYTTSPVTAEENLEAKGCAANFDDDLIQFLYTGTLYTEAEVTNPNNWVFDENEDGDCNNQNVRACAIRVSPNYVDDSGLKPELENTILLTATPHLGGSYYISGSADNLMTIINKSTP